VPTAAVPTTATVPAFSLGLRRTSREQSGRERSREKKSGGRLADHVNLTDLTG
jgi:hypothetical protein